MSASTTRSPLRTRRLGAPFRPPWAVPPAPRAPVGFSNVAARESRRGSMCAGFQTGSIASACRAPHGEEVDELLLAADAGLVERGVAAGLAAVDVRAPVEQLAHLVERLPAGCRAVDRAHAHVVAGRHVHVGPRF